MTAHTSWTSLHCTTHLWPHKWTPPPGTLGDQLQIKQDLNSMDQHHASRPSLSTLDQKPIISLSGTPEALVIKPALLELAPSPCKDATPRSQNYSGALGSIRKSPSPSTQHRHQQTPALCPHILCVQDRS